MNRKEVAEIKKNCKPDGYRFTLNRIVVCIVDAEGNIKYKDNKQVYLNPCKIQGFKGLYNQKTLLKTPVKRVIFPFRRVKSKKGIFYRVKG